VPARPSPEDARPPTGGTVPIPVDSETYMNFLYSRPTSKTLDRIHERDGARIFKEAADHLLLGIIMSVERHTGPKGLRRAVDELADQAASISGLSAHVRKVIRQSDRPAAAA
jgi:hypothetical protein